MFEPAPPEPEVPQHAVAAELAPWSASTERPAFARPAPEPGNGLATTSLVLSIIGLFVVFLSAGFGAPFSLPCSIAGWVTGSFGRKQVARGLTKAGDGVAHAGVVLGIVGVILGVIGAIVWLVLLAESGWDLEELRREFERR
jgi:hypothetical protein